MKVLAIETSSSHASVAVALGNDIIAERRFQAPRGRGAEVFSILEEMRPLWQGIDRMAIGLGPGSYNGLRVACAIAGSFQLALGIEIITVPSPCLLDSVEKNYFAAGDARGGRTWLAEIKNHQLQGEICLLTKEEWTSHLGQKYSQLTLRVGPVPGAESLPQASPLASVLARLASSLVPADPTEIEPLYLKPPHITTPRASRP